MKKKGLIAVVALAACVVMAVAFTACGGGKTYKTSYDDGAAYVEASLPVHTISQEYAWNMMGIAKVDIELTISGDNYTYYAQDISGQGKDSATYYYKTWTYTGTCSSNEDGSYTLSKPTKVTVKLEYGAGFKEWASVFGEEGTFTEGDEVGKSALAMWATTTVTANVSGESVSFVIA